MKSKLKYIVPIIFIIVISKFYGMGVIKFQFPPYDIYRMTYDYVIPDSELDVPAESLETPEGYFKTDVSKLISIHQPDDVLRLRNNLIDLLWGNPGIPTNFPLVIVKGFEDNRYDDIENLSRIDKLTVEMEFGIESVVYHFIPKSSNNKVVFYHHGHGGGFYMGKEHFDHFIKSGYSVVAFSMPLEGLNNQPEVFLNRIGFLKMTTHDHMQLLQPENGHPVKYFIEPVVTLLNYLESNFYYSSVSMVGISGGGWTTTLAAAIDTRIDKNFPVAGSYPIYLRSDSQRDWGDYEQIAPKIYTTVNYLELYILGSYGEGRKKIKIINQFDSCCFAGTKWVTFKDIVKERVQSLGVGEFDIFVDDSHHSHNISQLALSVILAEIDSIKTGM